MGRKLYDLDYFKKLAIEKGGECLSNKYIRCDEKLQFKCKHGHVWDTKAYYLTNNNSWCPQCNKSAKDNIELFHSIAKSHDGKCLSLIYINCRTKLKFECKHGHVWESKPHDVKYSGSWCPICSNSIKLTINEMREIAKNRNGKCLSDEYFDSHTKLLWECELGHQWMAKPYLVKNSNNWCPICKSSHGENYVRRYLNENKILFIGEFKFNDCRGKKQQLPFDFYLPEYNVLIEYDGKQHFEPVNFYGCPDESAIKNYNDLKINDKIKNDYCENHNIILIRISYEIKKINEYLKNKLIELNVKLV